MAVKIDKSKRPVGKTYVVYDFADAPTWRWRTERGQDFRLEHYYFHCLRNGSYEFEFQEGWNAGSHYDGGTANNAIPEEWLKSEWDAFLDAFCEEYPEWDYFLSRSELQDNNGLKQFLGF